MPRSSRNWCDTADSLIPTSSAMSQTQRSDREIESRIFTRVASPSTLKVSASSSAVAAVIFLSVIVALNCLYEHMSNCSYVDRQYTSQREDLATGHYCVRLRSCAASARQAPMDT